MHKITKMKITATTCWIAMTAAWAETPQPVILDIGYQNQVLYVDDVSDRSKLAASATPVIPNLRTFSSATALGDIVSINGKPAKGSVVVRSQFLNLAPNAPSGQSIGDTFRPAFGDIVFEILQADGTPVGTLMLLGYLGGAAPPGAPASFQNNATVTGGTGAFLGARGYFASPAAPLRPTSTQEDPANRRVNGGPQGHVFVYLIPASWPEIVTTANGPAVLHAGDSTLVTAAKPARSGEILTFYATGLGPTRPALEPGNVFSASPLQVANSPVEVTIGGREAEVLYAGGYPGSTDGFQVNVRLPTGLSPGPASVRLNAAFVPSAAINIPIQ
ncbi:MAG: hypothetical protein C5B51_25740 [Terriglobia bacterium]|nr:MAG: hypothetical protein C5B51_25740 [Terriglobia bacterium]